MTRVGIISREPSLNPENMDRRAFPCRRQVDNGTLYR